MRTVVLLVGLSSLAWGLGAFWTREAGLDSAPGDPPGAGSAPAPARLGLHGNLPGAVATVIETSSGEMRWQGPADGRPLTLPQGDYSLVVEHPQCPDSWNEQIHLEPGQRVDRFAQNCRQHGLLAVRANVDEARISIDGRDVEAADGAETALPTGPHRIRVERTGYEPWETSVDLAAASRVSLQANLAPSAPPPAKESPAVASAAPDRETDRSEIRPPSSDVARRTHEWQRTATEYLLARYDRNQSGDLDSLSEIESIPCSDWRGLEQSFDGGGLGLSMTRFYGFDGSKWVDNAFGVTNEMRGGTNLRLKDCGLR